MSSTRPHALYRFHNEAGELLYVGITLNPGNRWTDHRHDKPWWTEVTHITIETHPDRASVLEAEAHAIHTEHPRYNIVHNHGRADRPWGSEANDMPDCCHHGCVPLGDFSMYYPRAWSRGRAQYECVRGHIWICSWGHDKSGEAPPWAGVPVVSP